MPYLQACPFCGSTRCLSLAAVDLEVFGAARRVYCSCGGRGPAGISGQAAADKWNQRAASTETELQMVLATLRAAEADLPEPLIQQLLEVYRRWRDELLE